MLRTYVYIPDRLEEKINRAVKTRRVSKAKVIRDALETGLVDEDDQIKRKASTDVMFKIAELAKRNKVKGPKDGSVRMDYYLWGGKDG